MTNIVGLTARPRVSKLIIDADLNMGNHDVSAADITATGTVTGATVSGTTVLGTTVSGTTVTAGTASVSGDMSITGKTTLTGLTTGSQINATTGMYAGGIMNANKLKSRAETEIGTNCTIGGTCTTNQISITNEVYELKKMAGWIGKFLFNASSSISGTGNDAKILFNGPGIVNKVDFTVVDVSNVSIVVVGTNGGSSDYDVTTGVNTITLSNGAVGVYLTLKGGTTSGYVTMYPPVLTRVTV